MQNELKQISLRWISIFSDSESKYVKYNKQSDFLSSHMFGYFSDIIDKLNESKFSRVS